MTADGFLTIDSSDYSLLNLQKTIHVRVLSLIHAGDTVSQVFEFHITYESPCTTTGLQNIPNDNYLNLTYYIGNAPQTINFSGINNGNCNFSMQVYVNSVGSATDIAEFGLIFDEPNVEPTSSDG